MSETRRTGGMRFPDDGRPRIFPAIDLRGGRCVRLIRGRRDAEIDYREDPAAFARRWVEEGAECLHVVDLGAALGEADSTEVVLEIARTAGVPVQMGGGVRDAERLARLLEGGVARVILGTRALRDPEFLAASVERWGAERIVVGLDCEGDRVKVSGWEEESLLDIPAAVALVRAAGVRHLLVTAIDRDGTLSGPRPDLVGRVLEPGDLRAVAAGGIGRPEHIETVLRLGHPGLEGVVVGRALYEGTVTLREALATAERVRRETRGRDAPAQRGAPGRCAGPTRWARAGAVRPGGRSAGTPAESGAPGSRGRRARRRATGLPEGAGVSAGAGRPARGGGRTGRRAGTETDTRR